jgi:hypothetical protein
MRTRKPRTAADRLKVMGTPGVAIGLPVLRFLGFSLLPVFCRGNQDLYD